MKAKWLSVIFVVVATLLILFLMWTLMPDADAAACLGMHYTCDMFNKPLV